MNDILNMNLMMINNIITNRPGGGGGGFNMNDSNTIYYV